MMRMGALKHIQLAIDTVLKEEVPGDIIEAGPPSSGHAVSV